MENIIDEINENLMQLTKQYLDGQVKEAMQYSLMAGGKRIRPYMMLQVIRSYGLSYQPYLDIACAIEMIHTYSLIHDDLPDMDNDDLRRGKPTCHKQFNGAVAILAGDALLNEAVNTVLHSSVAADQKMQCLEVLMQASGVNGMIHGQQLDMEYENKQASKEELETIHYYKTGALISASLVMGAIASGSDDLSTWQEIGYKIGLAFQIQDDVLDVISDSQTLGKKVGSDIENNKSTYVSLLGVEEASMQANLLFEEAIVLLYGLRINHGLLLEIIETLRKRVN